MATYENTPREKWLFLYPAQVDHCHNHQHHHHHHHYLAQVALAGTQIWWTSEVKLSLLIMVQISSPSYYMTLTADEI